MKTLERYVFKSFFSSFLLAFLVLSFVLTIGLFVQIVGYVMDGVPMRLVGEFCLVSLPETLQWSIPLALLVSAILVFSRLSADSEIAAMRSCGVNLLRIVRWPLLFAFGCTLLGCWVNNEIVPHGHRIRRTLKTHVTADAVLSLIQPGEWLDEIPDWQIFCERKEGQTLYGVKAYHHEDDRRTMLKAPKAIASEVPVNGPNGVSERHLRLEAFNGMVDYQDGDRSLPSQFNRLQITIDHAFANEKYDPSPKDMGLRELLGEIARLGREVDAAPDDLGDEQSLKRHFLEERSSVMVELMKRFVFAMASICFILIGVPLGIRSQRRESSVGMAISLAVALGYYVVVILMLSFQESYRLHPETLIWLPVAVCFVLAAKFMRRHL